MAPYKYQPLDLASNAIRLVELSPLWRPSDLIRLRIFHVSLGDLAGWQNLIDPQEFEASVELLKDAYLKLGCFYTLSYTWDAPYLGLPPEWDNDKATKIIKLDDQDFEVRWNLESVLRHIGQRIREPVALWIDAICIEQANLAEKSAQIQLMAAIYTFSRATYVWLGPDTEESIIAAQAISQYGKAWLARKKELKDHAVLDEYLPQYKPLAATEIGSPGSLEQIRAIAHLLLRNWWFRAWVVQEAVLAMDLLILCGDSEPIEWQLLSGAFDLLNQHRTMFKRLGDISSATEPLLDGILSAGKRFININELRSVKVTKGFIFHSLPATLGALQTANASNARDKVFAGLAVSRDSSMIAVNYESSVEEIFISTSRAWIEQRRSLEILSYCVDSFHKREGLPSWAVDWTNIPRRFALPRKGSTGVWKKIYCAGGDKENFSARFIDQDKCTLFLKGIQIGKITFVASPNHNSYKVCPRTFEEAITLGQLESRKMEENFNKLNSWLEKWIKDRFLQHSLSWKQGAPKIGPKSTKTLVYKYTQEELAPALMRICCADTALKTNSAYMGRAKDIIPSDYSIPTQAQRILVLPAISLYMLGRTFISTSKGMVGLAPEETRKDDLVCIISGNETPVVLRSCGSGRYTWVGECYIHGIMDGEYMELSKQWGLETLSAEFCIV